MELAQSLGFTIQRHGSHFKLKEHDSCIINPQKNTFFRYSAGIGGDTIQFIEHFLQKTFPEAVNMLAEKQGLPVYSPPVKPAEKKTLQLPEHGDSQHAVTRYLNHRGIHKCVVVHCMQTGLVYQEAGKYQNIVYIGADRNGEIRFAAKESTLLKLPPDTRRFKNDLSGSAKAFSFHILAKKESSAIVVCESPIDAMSYASLLASKGIAWSERHYVSLGGISDKALFQYLQDHSEIKTVTLALDNDEAGKNAATQIKGKLERLGYIVKEPIPLREKDYNDMLVKIKNRAKSCER